MDRRIPILYLAPWVDLGGSDKGTIDWFRHIDRSRWAPSLITTQPSDNRWLAQVEAYAEEVWTLPTLMGGGDFPAFILDFIESRGIEVVHIMNSRLGFDLIPDIKFVPRPPAVVVQLHAEEPDRSGYVRYVATRYSNLIDAYSVISRDLANAMEHYDIPAAQITVIPNGIDARSEFNPDLVRPLDPPGGNGVPRILWPGRLVAQKDPLLTIEVVKTLKDRGLEFSIDIVGEGELKPAAMARADDLGVSGRIRWHPPSAEMPRWYRSSDLLLMTSAFEGVPYVVYEASAMGVPVVAPALPGIVEFMGDVLADCLIDPRDDVAAYADVLEHLLSDREMRARVGSAAREHVLNRYSAEEMCARHDSLYSRLLEEQRVGWSREVAGSDDVTSHPSNGGAADSRPTRLTLPRSPAPEATVAVIVPCYQHGKFLHEAIGSVLEQTLPASRIVVVDDASTDGETRNALARWDSDERVQIIRLPENSGPSAARNRGLAEVKENYVLPLDADDRLLPNALADMVKQLQQASSSVGFIYPNAQHFGNRNDYWIAPAYNLNLLLANNYCASASLFDRRVFDAGVRYPDDMVYGHEDWDLVLQMAERDVYGEPAGSPTFLYRTRGFSRVNIVNLGSAPFYERLQRRHPLLFEHRRDEIKARWAPALSVILLDETEPGWLPEELRLSLESQTCRDFELICGGASQLSSDSLVSRHVPPGATALETTERQLAAARGRFVILARPHAPLLGRRTFAEQVIRLLWQNQDVRRVAFARSPGFRGPAFAPLSLEDIEGAHPGAIAWRRSPHREDDLSGRWFAELDEVEVAGSGEVLDDIVGAWEAQAPVSWRMG